MRSRPRVVDARPSSVVAWTAGETLAGDEIVLPAAAHVTSRGDVQQRRSHYALVCQRDVPLALGCLGVVDARALVNLLSGNPVGASQVTAVVKHHRGTFGGPEYSISFRATLVEPYFIRLRNPVAPVAFRTAA
jgi:hypothetical protein